MTRRTAPEGLVARVAKFLAVTVIVAGCSGGGDKVDDPGPAAPEPSATGEECGDFRIAYDASSGYEASAFIVGSLAATELDCNVEYVRTTARQAWRVVATGDADVYLDAYGSGDLERRLTASGGPVTVVGPNGINGGVDLLAPAFMGARGLLTAQDLPDIARIGWGLTTPAITTTPELLALARAFVDFEDLDYTVRDFSVVNGRRGMRFLLQQPRSDDDRSQPNLYLVAAPRPLLGDGEGREVVEIPESASQPCVLDAVATLCSLADFSYQKIANAEFASSDSPAYRLVYNYRLNRNDAATIIELVELSGYDVGPADVASWLNTHEDAWQRWLD